MSECIFTSEFKDKIYSLIPEFLEDMALQYEEKDCTVAIDLLGILFEYVKHHTGVEENVCDSYFSGEMAKALWLIAVEKESVFLYYKEPRYVASNRSILLMAKSGQCDKDIIIAAKFLDFYERAFVFQSEIMSGTTSASYIKRILDYYAQQEEKGANVKKWRSNFHLNLKDILMSMWRVRKN